MNERAAAPETGHEPIRPATEVWFADLDAAAPALAELDRRAALVDQRECATLTSEYGATSTRKLAARRALRFAIHVQFGESFRARPIVLGPRGKPAIDGLPGDFSLSHSGRWLLIATTRAPRIGVDLEAERPSARPVSMSRARQDAIVAAARLVATEPPAITDFFVAWVHLEAVAKATGLGIGPTLSALGVRGRVPSAVPPPEGWPRAATLDLGALEPRPVAGLRAAIAGNAAVTDGPLVIRRLPDTAADLERLLASSRVAAG
ncbi:MAG: hypothetical protein NW216_08900 [Hyphomicrobium sp.]|nr:hypothetical protein [Hyphomicrobium sp.]